MSRIHALDALVVNQIAAGEVIERPASVVKELLENSIDALATRVDVEIGDGGSELIRVADDGEGIHPDDFALAVTSHATSKIAGADDLFRVRTMGFRGEALASIAAVSRMRLRSRRAEAEGGCELLVEGGQPGALQPCGCPVGTVVEVRNLLYNTPVRRKFLRAVATEFGHISEQFTRVALAHPKLTASLRHNQRSVYELPPTGQVLDRLKLFFGSDLADKLIWVESQTAEARIWGYVAHPSESRATRKGQYLFLNGRWIQDRSLQHALGEAYRGLLMTGRYPVVFLFLELAPELVDVNVHPTKAEVRFRDNQPLYRLLLAAIRTRFLSANLESTISVPKAAAWRFENFAPDRGGLSGPAQRDLQLELAEWARSQLSQFSATATTEGPTSADASPSAAWPLHSSLSPAPAFGMPAVAQPSGSPFDVSPPPVGAPVAESSGADSSPAGFHSGSAGLDRDPGLTQVMQVHDCYLVVETAQGITVIDQHALHERVMYEHLRHRVDQGAVESQRMLVPQPLDFSDREAATLLEHADVLSQIGYRLEEFGGATVLLSAYPAILAHADHDRILRDAAESLGSSGQKPSRRDILDSLLHLMACKAAVKAGQRLKPEEMESLLAQRHLIDDAHHCPHGRPTALVLTRAELDRQFGRLG
ncbi:MAG TPA: DNA mismatch repair endonuclease MutL [Planctomycetaceae bacterium]|jgi:DNA mismatch repair protein MutL|nr:DNA mismatch repair endonuclease MutL [Planctomycetaceae bacterium]